MQLRLDSLVKSIKLITVGKNMSAYLENEWIEYGNEFGSGFSHVVNGHFQVFSSQ